MEWNNELIIEFLDLYEGESIIWNPQHQHHKDRNQVYDAWKRIQSNFSLDFSLKVLKKKKENLMCTYRKLSIKAKNSARTGAGVFEIYKPEWFAYEKMASFLHSVYLPRATKTTEILENERDLGNQDETTDVVDEVESPHLNSTFQEEEGTAVNEGGPPMSKKRKVAITEKRMNEAYLLLKQVANKPKAEKDESQLFCDLLCLKLRALDGDRRESAMHEINNLMFRFKHQASSIPSTPIPYYQQPGYFPGFAQQWHGLNNQQLPNYGFRENSFSHLPPAHTSSALQPNENDGERETLPT